METEQEPLLPPPQQQDGMQPGEPAEQVQLEHLSPHTASEHVYLGGEHVDLVSSGGLLEEGSTHTLPLVRLKGVILFPGSTLPLIIGGERNQMNVGVCMNLDLVLNNTSPSARLVVVINYQGRMGPKRYVTGVTAEIIQLRKGNRAGRGCILVGRQRVTIDLGERVGVGSLAYHLPASTWVPVTVLPNDYIPPMPRAMREGFTAVPAPVAAPYDVHALAAKARALFAQRFPRMAGSAALPAVDEQGRLVTPLKQTAAQPGQDREAAEAATTAEATTSAAAEESKESEAREEGDRHTGEEQGHSQAHAAGSTHTNAHTEQNGAEQDEYLYVPAQPPMDPLALSNWIAANLPVSSSVRRLLLDEPTAAHRLRAEIAHMHTHMDRTLRCARCTASLACASDMFVSTDEGAGAIFCNEYGYVHDSVTFSKLHEGARVRLQRPAQEKHSFHPGYVWWISSCGRCNNHLGWRFRAPKENMRPYQFWGIRRDALTEALPTEHMAAIEEEAATTLYESEDSDLAEESMRAPMVPPIHEDEEGGLAVDPMRLLQVLQAQLHRDGALRGGEAVDNIPRGDLVQALRELSNFVRQERNQRQAQVTPDHDESSEEDGEEGEESESEYTTASGEDEEGVMGLD